LYVILSPALRQAGCRRITELQIAKSHFDRFNVTK
jgi:hypothetical protein